MANVRRFLLMRRALLVCSVTFISSMMKTFAYLYLYCLFLTDALKVVFDKGAFHLNETKTPICALQSCQSVCGYKYKSLFRLYKVSFVLICHCINGRHIKRCQLFS